MSVTASWSQVPGPTGSRECAVQPDLRSRCHRYWRSFLAMALLLPLFNVRAEEPGELATLVAQIERLADSPFPDEEQQRTFESLVTRCARLFPQEPVSLFWQGALRERQHDSVGAAALWRQALECRTKVSGERNEPTWARCCQRLGALHLDLREAAQAEELAQRSIRLAPGDLRGYRLLLDATLHTGHIFAALQAIREAARQFGDSEPAFTRLYFETLTQVGDWQTFRQLVTKRAQHASPLDGDVHQIFWLGWQSWMATRWPRFFITALPSGTVARTGRPLRDPLGLCAVSRRGTRLYRPCCSNCWSSSVWRDRAANGFAREGRVEAAQELLRLPVKPPADNALARLVVGHDRALALTAIGDLPAARKAWQQLVDEWPDFAPALCGLAEIFEVTGQTEEARRLFEQARALCPTNGKVQLIDRLGGKFQLADDGVAVTAVAPGSPLDRFGLRPGDVVLALDGEPLAKQPTLDRLRAMRLFQGGEVTYRTANGESITDEMELVLFAY